MSTLKSNWKSSVKKGEYLRKDSQFRHWVTADGSAGPTGDSGFEAQSGRYHLYVSLACPWAHRTLVFRKLMGLEQHISVSVVHPDMHQSGWSFDHDEDSKQSYGTTGDELFGSAFMSERYFAANPDYNGNITVPVLWDKHRETIVSNESSEIIRMFNSAFNQITGNTLDYYPLALKDKIDEVNEWIYSDINNGVYKTGFATTQQAYETHAKQLFAALDKVNDILAHKRYLTGDTLTEADWRLWTTLIRFDAVYHTHFKCNLHLLSEYHHIYHYMLELYQMTGISETVNMAHIKRHYYASHTAINPYAIVPLGHAQDWQVPHNRQTIK